MVSDLMLVQDELDEELQKIVKYFRMNFDPYLSIVISQEGYKLVRQEANINVDWKEGE